MPLIAHSSPDGRIQLFNEHVRAEFLNGELFETMHEAQVLTQRWVRYYNQVRPHSSLGGRPPHKTWSRLLLSTIYLLTLLLSH